MRSFSVLVSVTAISALCFLSGYGNTRALAREQFPVAVQINAPDRLSTKVYANPSKDSEVIGIALHHGIYEVTGTSGDFVEIVMPDSGTNGYVLSVYTIPWEAPKAKGISPVVFWLIGIILGLVIVAVVVVAWTRAKKTKVAEVRAASIPAAIKRAEEAFRAADYDEAVREFNSYLDLQGGDVRNPDVYRRISVCYQNMGETREAAKAWEKMRELGGLKGSEDYALGVSLMMSLGKESEAAQIYEQLLKTETDETKRLDIHKTLYHTYRRLKDGPNFLRHGLILMGRDEGKSILGELVSFLVSEGQTDAALELNHDKLITGISEELLEEKVRTPEAARIYLKALEYNRTDKRLHGMLSQIYAEGGDYRRAVSELTILYQLDKGQNEQYLEQAARLYMEHSRVQEALVEGNPLIIKKLAQNYLARSEVNPDAVAVYEKVLEFQPNAVGINKMLSTVYMTRGDLSAYMEKLRLLHEIDGTNHDYLTDLAKCIIDNDLVDQTIKEGNRELNSKILKQLIKRGASDDAAVALFEKLIRYEPQNVPIRSALVSAYDRRKEYGLFVDHALPLLAIKRDSLVLADKVAAIAVENNFLEKVVKFGTGKVVELTATKLTGRAAPEAESRQVLEKALAVSRKESDKETPPQRARVARGTEAVKAAPRDQPPSPSVKQGVTKQQKRGESPTSSESAPKRGARQREKAEILSGAAQPSIAERPEPIRVPPTASVPSASQRPPQPEAAAATTDPSPDLQSDIDFGDLAGVEEIPERASSDPVRRNQLVDVTGGKAQMEARAITTFVSGYSTSLVTKYEPEELYLPPAGGLAYKDLEVLFSDGWSNFHVGIEVRTNRTVLLRVLRRDLLESLALREFVKQVSELGYTIVHDHILPLQEVVTGPAGAQGMIHSFYSRNLEQVLTAKRLELKQALTLFDQLLSALIYAHNYKGLDGKLHRIYHLHLHPSQIVVGDDLTDCRIASLGYSQVYRNLTRAAKPRWQEPGMHPASMPPEFFRSKAGGVRERHSELYSLGVLLYAMVTGEYPFEGPAFEDFKFQHVRISPTPPSLSNSDIPVWLDQLILCCLEKDPLNRWDDLTELQEEYHRGLTRAGIR